MMAASGSTSSSKRRPKARVGNRQQILGLRNESPRTLVKQIKKGLPYEALERLQQQVELPRERVAKAMRLSERTLKRRKEAGKLEPEESDRLVRLATILEKATDLFDGDRQAAVQWLTRSNRALHEQTPLEFAETEVGAREVEDLILRLEHGVFT